MIKFSETTAHIHTLVRRILPRNCLLCASTITEGLLCIGCQIDLPHVSHKSLCHQCGLQIESLSHYCGHCLHQPPAFERSIIPFAYQYPLDGLIHRFKYRGHLTSGKALAQLLAEHLKYCMNEFGDNVTMPELLIPAPMHWLKRWQRGFNQAEFLARYIAGELNIPLASHLVKRTHKTPAQKELTRDERQRNLRKAFAIPAKYHAQIQGKRIAVIDDVVTTTATVRELSQLLMKNGAKEVQVWALARTM